jgi:hypothetical protein
MFCECGTENPDGSAFCNACGKRLNTVSGDQVSSSLQLHKLGASLSLVGYILLMIPLLAGIFACVWIVWAIS